MPQVDPDFRMVLPEPLQGPGQDVERSRISARDAHLARVEIVERPGELAGQAVHALHERNRDLVEPLPGRRKRDARAVSFEEHRLQLVLELAYVEGHRRLAAEELLGRLGHASKLRRVAECLELAETVPLLIERPAVCGHSRDDASRPRPSSSMNRSAVGDGTRSRRVRTPYRRFRK